MKRGELSNEPAPVLGVDWNILVEANTKWLGWDFKLKRGAKGWIDRNWQVRMCVVTVGVPKIRKNIEKVLDDYIAEFEHFDSKGELRTWLNQNPQIFRFYTNDPLLLGLDGVTKSHSGWNERVGNGL